jgi:uncharacterized protein
MPYLIDGHNLIGQLPDLSLTDEHDEVKLFHKLVSFTARTKKRVTVVFDRGLPGGKSPLSNGMIEVIFAPQGGSADAIMQRRISDARDPGQWIVVSNDHAVLNAARLRGMRALRCAEFVPLLQPPPAPKVPAREKHKQGETMDVHVPKAEVDEWLRVFEEAKRKGAEDKRKR